MSSTTSDRTFHSRLAPDETGHAGASFRSDVATRTSRRRADARLLAARESGRYVWARARRSPREPVSRSVRGGRRARGIGDVALHSGWNLREMGIRLTMPAWTARASQRKGE